MPNDTTIPNKNIIANETDSREAAEAAREKTWEKPSFLRELFLGDFRLDLLHPFPEFPSEFRPEFQAFYQKLKSLLEETDSEAIDRQGKIPTDLITKLAKMGAFGMKIKKKYGGLEFSQAEYATVMKLLGSRDANITALLSAHQSIGVPQPVNLFGTKAQKEKYLPRIAKGAVTAFALTEPQAGSDPAKLTTTVQDSKDGQHYILNGTKLWITNGTIAELLIVMARHQEDGQISAFIVESGWQGVDVTHRCRFMGLKALENGQLSFTNVKIPKENLLWKKGQGLKLALITLNTGRLALPASAAGGAKICLEIARRWASERKQWGRYIGHHEAIAHKVADIAATTFAMESVSDAAIALSENGFDIRLEAAMAKLYNTEAGWKIVDETMQLRGGRGYETADSLKNRGEDGISVERLMRDWRINTIFEGSSEIMRLFIAREAVDKHLQIAGILLDKKTRMAKKFNALPAIASFYIGWFYKQWFGLGRWRRYREFGRLARHLRFINRTSRRLSRQIFYGMLWHRLRLEKRQAFLGRIVDIGAELFAMTTTISRAKQQFEEGNRNSANVADVFCQEARHKIEQHLKALWHNQDRAKYKLGRQVLDHQFTWLEVGSAGLPGQKVKKKYTIDDPETIEAILTSVLID